MPSGQRKEAVTTAGSPSQKTHRLIRRRFLLIAAVILFSVLLFVAISRRIPSMKLFVKIARVLGVSTDYLLGNTDEEGILFDGEVRSIVRDYQALNPRDRETVSCMTKFLSQKQTKDR